jgi:hypothetical protein
MSVLRTSKRIPTVTTKRRFMHVRLAALALIAPSALLLAGCNAGPVTTADEGIAVTTQPITGSTAVSRAMEWVDVDLTYCQSPNGAPDPDPACSPTCRRQKNTKWDPYRSDCSGLVSWAWKIPAPGLATRDFAPFNEDGVHVSHEISPKDLQPGDALNGRDSDGSGGHIILFKAWAKDKERTDGGWNAVLIEEPGCRTTPDYAHEFVDALYIHSDDTVVVSGYDQTFHAIRYNKRTAEKTDEAKAVGEWSNAERFGGKNADYLACAGDDLKLSFTFRNVGTAVWRDVQGRGKSVGSDVFLVTTSGKKDRITGQVRYSVRLNQNRHVRGDRNAPNCSDHNGCRDTTFIEGRMSGQAPNKPGIYASRWRLRDYSRYWGDSSHGFGPKVQLRLKVVSCQMPAGHCGCRAWCDDGKSHVLSSDIKTRAACTKAAMTFCYNHFRDASALAANFRVCSDGQTAGSSETPASPNGSDATPASGQAPYQPEDNDASIEINSGGSSSEVQDDPGFSDNGFNGDDKAANLVPDSGCSVADVGNATGTSLEISAFMFLLALAEIRRRARRRVEGRS